MSFELLSLTLTGELYFYSSMNISMPLVRPYLQVTWIHHPHDTLMIMLFEKGRIIFAIFSFPKSTNQVVYFPSNVFLLVI